MAVTEENSKKVTVIPARKESVDEASTQMKKRRVAAYARVSTTRECQQTSYEAQIRYYTDFSLCFHR